MNDIITELVTSKDLKELVNNTLDKYSPFFISVSGAHIYGFPSPDSDIDLRGTYFYDLNTLLGFWNHKDLTIEKHNHNINGVEIDFVAHELNKYISMIITGQNGYVLEQIFSPIMVYETDEFKSFQNTVKKYFISRLLYKHYSGFAHNKIEEFKNQQDKKVKTLLYAFRILLTGIHVFNSGEIKTNLSELNQEISKFSYIEDLIKQKQQENKTMSDEKQIAFYIDELDKLMICFEESYQNTTLPDIVRNKHKLTTYLSNVYSKKVLNKDFVLPVMRNADDRRFINNEKEKLLIASSPFFFIERELNIKLSPQKIVFMPTLDRYFLLKQEKPRGRYYEFIDMELFLKQLYKSNPFCLLALFNPDKEKFSSYLEEVLLQKEKFISRQLFTTFSGVAKSLDEKLKLSSEIDYNSNNVILMLAILIQGTYLLKYGEFSYDFTPYFQMFKSIKHREITKKQLLTNFEELNQGLQDAYNKSSITRTEPDKEYLQEILINIKKQFWL